MLPRWFTVFTLATFMSLPASRMNNFIRDLLENFGFIPSQDEQLCEKIPAHLNPMDAETLWRQAEAKSRGYDKCEAASYYWELIRQHGGGKYYTEAWRKLLQVYI
ncbi:MAG: hypothetical protein N2578_04995 [Bdellovibrionaceae bacterium]|nr:hypothetical protein [Pseudobdellovibrionaceae bacterium]